MRDDALASRLIFCERLRPVRRPPRSRPAGGLGLGLTIVRRLIELHEGRVEAKSEGVGMGSEFVVRLPVLDAVQDAPPAPQPHRPTTAGLKVLLVEDSQDTADMMASALEMLGCHVAIAHDGPAALAAVATDCPDVGLLDIGLPGMSGYELAAKLRAGGFCPPSLKLVAVTGYARAPEALAAAGFDGHLAKPVDFEQMGETLASSSRRGVSGEALRSSPSAREVRPHDRSGGRHVGARTQLFGTCTPD